MTLTPDNRKEKPFRLVKYFTFSSLIVIFISIIVLSVLNTHIARTIQRQKTEDYARVLVENLNHQIFLQFYIPVIYKYGKIQLRDKDQFERMDKVVRSTLYSFDIKTLNIYDFGNTVSYSYDKAMIGKKNAGGAAYQNALKGQSSSKLFQRGNFFEILFGFPKESLIITTAPIRAEEPLSPLSGPVMGVVEIVQDLTRDYLSIFRYQVIVVSAITVVLCGVFLVLLFVVKKGEGIIQQRALERLRLEEKLSRARHLSSLGEMTAGISHEIRNPLGIIQSSAELLKKKIQKTDPGNTIPDIIVEEATRLNNIITDFLNYAKPKVPNRVPCDLLEIIEKNLTYLQPQMDDQGYRVKKRYDGVLPRILADTDMLYQAFLNILINAMQAMSDSGIIWIHASTRGDKVVICIEDEGSGIPAENIEKIWEPFFTTKDMGTGLGLGIVKNIIEAHDGTIMIMNNTPIKGTRVQIELPVFEENETWKPS